MLDNKNNDPNLINFTEKYGPYKKRLLLTLKEDIEQGRLNTLDVLNLLSYTMAQWIITIVTDDIAKVKDETLALNLTKECYDLMRNYINDFIDNNRSERNV